jgi:hypothetical protein
MAEPPEGIVLTHFIVSDDVERSRRERPGCSIPDAAETARVREALLHPRSRRSSDRSGANHGPRGGLVARPLACEYARPGIRVNRAGEVVRVRVTRRWVMT